tara:strand:+ start:831 stop:1703 length:873 start_codon:yes stop_codon:yes gene_type:complete
MKKLYEFTVSKKDVVKEKTESENEKGEKVTVEKEVEKLVPHKFFLRKPTRSMYDEAELFYGVKLAEGVKAGLLNHALLAKRYNNDGGIYSEDQKDDFANTYFELLHDQTEYQQLAIKGEERDDKENEEFEELEKKLSMNRRKLQAYEAEKASLFDQTAETRARNKTVFWWVLSLSYKEEESGENNPVFGTGSFDEMLARYDEMEDSDDPYFEELIQRLVYYISFWYSGRASTKEEFDELTEQATEEYGINLDLNEQEPEEVEEEPKEEVKPKRTRRKKQKVEKNQEEKSE